MKGMFLHMIAWVLLCTQLCSCSSHDEQLPEPTRKVMLNLSISTRAADGESLPRDLQIWLYGKDATTPLFYQTFVNMTWTRLNPSDTGTGKEVIYVSNQLISATLKASDLERGDVNGNTVTGVNLRVHAVVNAFHLSGAPGKSIVAVGGTSSEETLKAATFSMPSLTQEVGGNEVLMYGTQTVDELKLNDYNAVTVSCERSVAKMELFVTQLNTKFGLKMKKVELQKVPSVGYLTPQASLPTEGEGTQVILDQDMNIDTFLSGYVPTGQFSANEESFTQIPVPNPYFAERSGKDERWKDVTSIDDVYDGTGNDDDDAYLLKLTYVMPDGESGVSAGTEKIVTRCLALQDIERNTIYRIFIRIKGDQKLEVNTATVDWVQRKGQIIVDITPVN